MKDFRRADLREEQEEMREVRGCGSDLRRMVDSDATSRTLFFPRGARSERDVERVRKPRGCRQMTTTASRQATDVAAPAERGAIERTERS